MLGLRRLSICLVFAGAALACNAPPAPVQVMGAQPAEAQEPKIPLRTAPGAPEGTQPRAAVAEHEHEHAHAHGEHHPHHPQPAAAAAATGLVRIADSGNICMLSNRYLGEKKYVPSEVDGKTYYGCCAGCAAKLAATPEARVAVDPVSGKSVDKATAVLARDGRGQVLYFESEETFARAQQTM